MEVAALIIILIFIIISLIFMAIMQIKMAGMNIKDFWDFIQANDLLDRLYDFSKKYDNLNIKKLSIKNRKLTVKS